MSCTLEMSDCRFFTLFAHMAHFQAIHGTLKTTEGPPNLGINLPLSTKPTNSNSTNSKSPRNNNKDGRNINGQNKGEKKPSALSVKKNNSNCSEDLKSPPSSGYTCKDCNSLFSSRELFVVHMRREHAKVNICHSHKKV